MRRRTAVVIVAGALALTGLIVGAVVAFPHSTIARGDARPVALPAQLEPALFQLCATTADSAAAGASTNELAGPSSMVVSTSGWGASFAVHLEAVDAWRLDVDRHGATVQFKVDGGLPVGPAGSPPSVPVAFGEQLYHCMSPYRFDQRAGTLSGFQLVQLYRYDRAVLWPCLRAHGIDPGPPPQLSQFASPVSVQAIQPFGQAFPRRADFRRIVAAAEACPTTPRYLG